MTKATLKAIAKRVNAGLDKFKIGRYTYYADYENRVVIHYLEYFGGPQITFFDELPLC